MRKFAKKILSVIPIISLLYIRYYESSLYFAAPYTWKSRICDLLYSYVFIPMFYIVTFILIFDILFEYLRLTCLPKICRIIKIFLLIVLVSYSIYLIILILSASPITIKPFLSFDIMLYSIFGGLCSFLINNRI